MPVNARRLRIWFVSAGILLLLVVAGFYWYGRLRARHLVREVPKNSLGADIQQSTEGFSYSHSEGGRTLYTIHASKAVQFARGGRAELRDVNIIVYGRESNRYDQIYGAEFSYDPQSGDVAAHGEVHIDLEANTEGPIQPDQAPPRELRNPIHLKTSDLVFNQKTGLAQTKERIEFRIPQTSGSAVGAIYDSHANKLTLQSAVRMQTMGRDAAALSASQGVITKQPTPRVQLANTHLVHGTSIIDAKEVTVLLRPDNSVERLIARGDVSGDAKGKSPAHVTAPYAEVVFDTENNAKSAVLTGGVNFDAAGDRSMQGSADRAEMTFGPANRLQKLRAIDHVNLVQESSNARSQTQNMSLTADAVDFITDPRGSIKRAETSGAAKIVFAPRQGSSSDLGPTTVTAGRFVASFGPKGRMQSLAGEHDARLVASTPGRPDKITTSDTVAVAMGPLGEITSITQHGNFHYAEPPRQDEASTGGREAWAEVAVYRPDNQLFALSGAPRVRDGGIVTTANRIRLNRRTGEAFADGDVKTTYSELKPQPNGALLATADPIHVTASTMTAQRSPAVAHYAGGARLWQGANIVEAPSITFDRDKRTVTAFGNAGQRVSTVFVESGQNGKQTPVNVTASRLNYNDADRQARFDGGAILTSAAGTMSADLMTVFLDPRGQAQPVLSGTASQLNRIVAQGHIAIQQPNRRATGDKLVYTAADSRFILTGGPPSIFDAEHGKITGDSLTFFSRDDRVLVQGGNASTSVTKARVIK